MATMIDGESYMGRVLIRPLSPSGDLTLYLWPLRCLKSKMGGPTFGIDVRAEQLTAFTRYFLCDVPVNQAQLDELYAVLRHVKDGERSDDDAIKRLERSPSWVWTAMDPESTLLVVMDVGTRTLSMAQRVGHQVIGVLARDCVPLGLTDGFREYLTALLPHYGQGV